MPLQVEPPSVEVISSGPSASSAAPATLHTGGPPSVGTHDRPKMSCTPCSVGSVDSVQVSPPSVVAMTSASPTPSLSPPAATQSSVDVHEMVSIRYVPFGSSFWVSAGRLLKMVQVLPPSVVLASHGVPSSGSGATGS